MAYFDTFATQLGFSVWWILIITIWEVIWTGFAMWKSAQKKHIVWFIVFLILNLFAIPEIVYLIVTRKKRRTASRKK